MTLVVHICNPSTRASGNRLLPEAHWAAHLPERALSRLRERCCLKEIRWRVVDRDTNVNLRLSDES